MRLGLGFPHRSGNTSYNELRPFFSELFVAMRYNPPLTVVFLLALVALAQGQIAEEEASEFGVRYGEPDPIGYRVGAEVTSRGGACRNIKAMVAVPFECPEQDVNILEEDFSSHVDSVSYRILQGGARQMLIEIPFLPDGATARAIVTFEVKTRPILPPESTSGLKIPARVTGNLRRFTNGSPYIEVRHRQIRSLAKEVLDAVPEDATDWQRIEALYDHVLETARYVEGPDKSAVDTLRDGFGDCQGRSALFIALCRSSKIPARMVWVDGHCFPEFYLLHNDKEGSWYPCESAGSRAFGEMPLARIVLQKGDKFRVPERPKEWLRYASDYLIGVPTPGGRTPKVQYIREQLYN